MDERDLFEKAEEALEYFHHFWATARARTCYFAFFINWETGEPVVLATLDLDEIINNPFYDFHLYWRDREELPFGAEEIVKIIKHVVCRGELPG